MCLLAGFVSFEVINWRTRVYEEDRISDLMLTEAHAFTQGTPQEIAWMIQAQLSHPFHGIHQPLIVSALLTATGKPIEGNLDHIPSDLPVDGAVHKVVLAPAGSLQQARTVIAVAEPLPNGDVLVVGRDIRVVATLRDIVVMALLPGAIWLIVLALGAGLWSNHRARGRLTAITQALERVMHGDMAERLPFSDDHDEITQLALSVNQMLAEIERLLIEAKGVSDTIAHDLRTPLARVRAMLERGREKAATLGELAAISDRAIASLDQAQTIITALLRIGEIQSGQRRAGFQTNDLNEILDTAAELYHSIAEEKGIQFAVATTPQAIPVFCDRDLMIEVAANLLDNAIKYTPAGGNVAIAVSVSAEGPVLSVSDNGFGIPSGERAIIMRRFHRLPQACKLPGTGLGLSIVQAIVQLHGFSIDIADSSPGCVFVLKCWSRPVQSQKGPAVEGRPASDPSQPRLQNSFT
jgi:hypothetical protein